MIKILFECHHLYYFPNFFPIIDELKKRGGYDIAVSIPFSMSLFERVTLRKAAVERDIRFIEEKSEVDRVNRLRNEKFNAVFVGNVGKLNEIVQDDAIAVMVYHGIGLKQTYYRDTTDRIDIRAIESEERFQDLKAWGEKNIHLTGFTKVDPLFNRSFSRSNILEALGLDPDRKTILYAPSFYPNAIDKILPELETLSAMFNIIIKLHQFSWHQARYRYHSTLAREVSRRSDAFKLLSKEDFDIIPFLASADLLLSDISSTIFEFLPLNRPILLNEFYTLRLKHRVFRKRFYRKLDLARLGKIDFVRWISEPDHTGTLIMDGLEHPEELKEERNQARNRYLYGSDGQASARLVDILESRIKTGRS